MTAAQQVGHAMKKEVYNEVRAAIEKAGANLKKMAKELVLIGFSDIADYIEIAEGGEITAIALDRMKKNKSRVIKKIREKRRILSTGGNKAEKSDDVILDSTFEIELYDKLDALKSMMKYSGYEPAITNKHQVTGKDGGPIQWVAAPQTASSIADWEAQVVEAKKAAEARAKETADAGNNSQP
jgi:hypothetical protein